MKVTIFTRFWMCCVLFAASVVNSLAADRLVIIGDAVWGGWSISDGIIMSSTSNDVWKATTHLEADKGFKFLTTNDFGGLEYRAGDSDVTLAVDEATNLVSSEDNSKDNKFMVSESANYNIVCDLANKTITVSKADYQDNAIKYNALWMVGSATSGGWSVDQGTQLSQDATNPLVYTATTYLSTGEFKVATNKYRAFDQNFFMRDANDDSKVVLGGDDSKWNITEAGTYDVALNTADMTISIKKHYVDFTVDHLFLVGDAVWKGWDLKNSVVLLPIEAGVFKATVHLNADKEFKFYAENDIFNGLQYRAAEEGVVLANGVAAALVSSEENRTDNKFTVSEAGNYDIVCDLNNNTIKVTKSAYQETDVNQSALWMVGDATPNGWSLDGAILMSQDEANPAVYAATADLKEGEFKIAVNKYGGYDQLFYQRDADNAAKVVLSNADNKWKIDEAGKYDVKLNTADMTISIVKNVPSSISSVEAEANAPVEYFTLDGKRVNNISAKGLYIKRQGGKAVKVVVVE